MSNAENNQETTRPGGITGNGFKPGQSGNPGGRPKGLARTVREVCGGSPRLAQVLLEIAENPKAHDRDRVAACRELLDRGWGKAPAFAAMEADDPLELSEIAREVQQIADELQARREAKAQRFSLKPLVCRAKRRQGRDWLGSRLGLAVGCCHPESLWGGRHPHCKAVWRPVTVGDRSRTVLAMQKVEGSSPFIRLAFKPFSGGRPSLRAPLMPRTPRAATGSRRAPCRSVSRSAARSSSRWCP